MEVHETYVGGPRPGTPRRGAAGKIKVAGAVARPATVAADGWPGHAGLDTVGYAHQPLNLSASWGDAALRLPATHLVFGLTKPGYLAPITARSATSISPPISMSSCSVGTAAPPGA